MCQWGANWNLLTSYRMRHDPTYPKPRGCKLATQIDWAHHVGSSSGPITVVMMTREKAMPKRWPRFCTYFTLLIKELRYVRVIMVLYHSTTYPDSSSLHTPSRQLDHLSDQHLLSVPRRHKFLDHEVSAPAIHILGAHFLTTCVLLKLISHVLFQSQNTSFPRTRPLAAWLLPRIWLTYVILSALWITIGGLMFLC